jgi:PAS domain S-box-containing protein
MEPAPTDYSSLFFLSPFPKWVYEIDTLKILDANEAAIQHYGYSREEFRELTIKDLRPKDEVPKIATALADIDSMRGNIYFGIFSHQKKSGEKIRMKINGHKVDFQGRKCLLVVGQDVTEEERNALAIKESEERLKTASSIAKLGYWRLDLATDTLTWSEEIYNIWEEDRSTFEVSFANFYGSIHPDDKEEFKARHQLTLETGNELDFVHRIILLDGRTKWVHELGRLIHDTSGNPIVLEGTIQDVTSQKESELHLSRLTEQLIESEAKFRTIFEIASLGIAQVEPATGQILLVNAFYETITGFSKSELLKMNFLELTHPEDRARDWELFQMALQGEVEFRNEKRYIRKDGTTVWVRLHVAVVRNLEGLPLRTVAICEDISTRKEEEQLRKLLESVIVNTSDAVLITEADPVADPGPRIVYVNEAFTAMTGYSVQEVRGKSPRILQGPKSDKEELARLGAALRNWEPCEITTINYKKNGEEYWVNFSVKPIANEKGEFTHWISIERDVTAKKQEELETNFLTQVSLIFNEEPKLAEACRKVCDAFTDFGDYDFAEIWTPNLEHTHIQLLSSCYHSEPAREFDRRSKGLTKLKFGEGLPGLLWESTKPKIVNLSDPTENFVRTRLAFESGITSVFGLPLFFSEKLVGVLIFGTSKNPDHLYRSKNLFQKLDTFIGSEINRKTLETDLQHLFEAIPYIICQSDFQGRIVRINRAGCELLGYQEEEILYHSFDEFVHPEDLEISYREMEKLGEGKTTVDFENRYLTKSGKIIWLSWNCNADLEEGLVYSSAKDISREKKLTQLHTEASSLARIGSWEIDLLNNQLIWTPIVHLLHETDPETFVPDLDTSISFYREDFREEVRNHVLDCISDGKEFNFDAVIITAKNNERWVRTIGNAEYFEGKCIRIYGSFQDIHTTKSLESQLAEILGSISDAFYAVDKDWNFTYFNTRAEQLSGKSAKDVLGKNIWKEFPGAVGTALEEIYRQVAKTGKTECVEYQFPGDGRWYELNAYPSNGGVSAYFKNIDERKEAAAALEKAYQEKNDIIESIADAFFTMNREFVVTYWNKAAEDLTGVKREALLGKTLWEAFPEGVASSSYINYHKVLEIGQPVNFEEQMAGWLEVNAYPSEEGLTVFFRDISIRKEADQRLLRALDEKNSILESIGDAFISLTPDWRVTYWNKEAEKVLGKKREHILGKKLWEEYTDAINTDFYRQYHKSLETQKTARFEEYYPTLDKWFEVSVYPSATGLSVYFKDVTLRKQADIRLIQANERFEKVTEATNDAIWDWDIKNNTFFRSKAIDKFLGKGASTSLREEDFWQDNFHQEDLPAIKQSIQGALQDPEISRWEMEYRIIQDSGEICYVVDKGIIVRDQYGNAVRMVGAMTDVSERKNYEAELIKLNESLKKYANELELTNEELEQFAFIASHDLQEPLRMISSFLDQLKRKYGGQLDDKAHEYIHFATDGARRMKQIILDLLDYCRAGKTQENRTKISLEQLIHDYKSLRKTMIEEKSVVINHPELPTIEGYRAPLTQVLHCLLDNAIKYTSEGTSPCIQLEVKETSAEWTFSVQDNGSGIATEFFDKIFVIFQRLHNRSSHSGSGIGLSIVKKQVESWGGKVWLDSKLGHGSIFYFTIPKE